MSAIGKGDWVQCIDPACDGGADADGILCGNVYVVAYLTPDDLCEKCGDAGPGFEVVGTPPSDDGSSWCACQFRPLGGNAKTLTAPPARLTEDA
jgi:hypothetical protein